MEAIYGDANMSGGGYGGGMGGFGGGYGNQGYGGGYGRGYGQQSFGGGQSQGYGGPQGFMQSGSFGGGNPWMRQPQGGMGYGNKMGFQPFGGNMGFGGNGMQQPQTGGEFQVNESQRFPRNGVIPPGQQSFTPPPLGANEGMQVAPTNTNSGMAPEMIPPGAMQKPMGYGGSTLDAPKAGGNIYGPQGAMSPPGAYDAMVRQGQEEYDARFKLPAQFGRYADGTPREDPNALNARGQAHQQWYGGGWGK